MTSSSTWVAAADSIQAPQYGIASASIAKGCSIVPPPPDRYRAVDVLAAAQPGPVAPGPGISVLPGAAPVASRVPAMLSACRWVGAWPSTAVRNGSRLSSYTVA